MYVLSVFLLVLLLQVFFNNKSMSTLLVISEAIAFLLFANLVTVFSITGLDFFLKLLITTLFLFSLEVALLVIVVYTINK